MVIDTSALVAILGNEPERERMAVAIDADPTRLVSAATVFETSIVLLARYGHDAIDDLELLLTRIKSDTRPFRADDLAVARRAYSQYGKGRHPAGLNFGDCFAYALSRITAQPLLFKGDDFAQTDVSAVLY